MADQDDMADAYADAIVVDERMLRLTRELFGGRLPFDEGRGRGDLQRRVRADALRDWPAGAPKALRKKKAKWAVRCATDVWYTRWLDRRFAAAAALI